MGKNTNCANGKCFAGSGLPLFVPILTPAAVCGIVGKVKKL